MFMEVMTLYLLGSNFKYIICCVYRSTGADPFLFNELFFNQVVSGLRLGCCPEKAPAAGSVREELNMGTSGQRQSALAGSFQT